MSVLRYGLGSRRAAIETTVTARETATAPSTTKVTVAPPTTAAEPSAEVMDEAAFWRLVTDTRAAVGDDTGRQSELLDARLRLLPAEQIAAFARIRHALDLRAYTWDVMGSDPCR